LYRQLNLTIIYDVYIVEFDCTANKNVCDHGKCNSANKMCSCDKGFTGPTCGSKIHFSCIT